MGIKRHQNRQPLLKHIFSVFLETQHVCYQCHVSSNVIAVS